MQALNVTSVRIIDVGIVNVFVSHAISVRFHPVFNTQAIGNCLIFSGKKAIVSIIFQFFFRNARAQF